MDVRCHRRLTPLGKHANASASPLRKLPMLVTTKVRWIGVSVSWKAATDHIRSATPLALPGRLLSDRTLQSIGGRGSAQGRYGAEHKL